MNNKLIKLTCGREQFLKDKKKETATNIPLLPKYNRTLPNKRNFNGALASSA